MTGAPALVVRRVGIVGGGIMGAGIAEVCARVGTDVVLVEVDRASAERTRARVESSLARAAGRHKIDDHAVEETLRHVRFEHDIDALSDRDFVVEAIVEEKRAKTGVFDTLRRIVDDPDAVLASNTSSIPIVELAAAAGDRADHVVGLHFFNPAPVLSLVEIIPSLLTAAPVVERARAFAAGQLGKQPIVAPDRAGFTVNALLIPYLLAAVRMFEQGLATAEDIDSGMVNGCAHPMGPLALADHIGLDTVLSVAETLYSEHREQHLAPPPLLQRLVAAGMLGRKTGRGLYSYS